VTKDWFLHNWMYAGIVAGVFLLAVVPLLAGPWSPALVLVYLLLPVYMVHQLEEHHDDRFRRWVNEVMFGGREVLTTLRRWVNEVMFGGREVLTTPAVVVINVVGVWMVDLAVVYLAAFVDIGLGLIAVYLTLVNGVTHIVAAVVKRGYNPGLVTSVVLFLPVGAWALAAVSAVPGVDLADQAIGLGAALLIHAAIVVHVKRRAAALAA